jgi:isocitrate/isopropylmalate dehydrogenase
MLPGDGIGPEITKATTMVLDEVMKRFSWPSELSGRGDWTCCPRKTVAAFCPTMFSKPSSDATVWSSAQSHTTTILPEPREESISPRS